MGKYKKKLRAEKAKVKLKKKKLPKGQNITDTTFKVKKIVTIEQLKKVNENEPVSSWNVPLKDLLVKLGHHNKSSKLNALNGVKEVIVQYPQTFKGILLKSTVTKVLEVTGDIESKVRSTAITLLDTLFNLLDSSEILGFHEILNIHLTCLMTHRNVEMQKDALKLADVIVRHAPEAIKKNIKVIITNFIRILSGYKYGAHSEIFLTKGSKKDLEENRIAIFQRLLNILLICYPEEKNLNQEEGLVLNARDIKFLSKKIFNSHLRKLPDLSDIYKTHCVLLNEINDNNFEEDFKLLISQIIPLLFETWAEFCPSPSNNGFIEECILKESTAKLLGLILEIVKVMFERSLTIGNEELRRIFYVNYGNKFIKLFLSSFPFLPLIVKDNIKYPSDIDERDSAYSYTKSYQSQNLTLCYLTYSMKLNINSKLRKTMDDYIQKALLERHTKCEEILSKIVEIMFSIPSKLKTDEFLETLVKSYKSTTNPKFQRNLLQILSKVMTNESKYIHIRDNQWIKEWTIHLAKGLCKSRIDFEAVITLSNLIQKKLGDEALKQIEIKFLEIVKNLSIIKIDGCDEFLGKKCIANILYWCDVNIIENALKTNVLHENDYSSNIKFYLLNIFNYKINNSK